MLIVEFGKNALCPWPEKRFVNLANKAARRVKRLRGIVEVNIVSDAAMKRLNGKWRKINRTTDVLSFAWQEDKKIESELLGQIYISYSQVARQAKEVSAKGGSAFSRGVPVDQEMARVFVHGLLHLAGYDHDTRAKEKRMFDLQEKIIR
jgi:probable rRNA maturation factor